MLIGLLITLSSMTFAPTAALALDSDRTTFIASGNTYYVDCTSTNSGTGTIVSPYNSLSAVNSVVLEQGDSIFFKRGSICLGQFAPSGSGTKTSPIIISAYGSGIGSPIINANGQTNAVLLKNMQYVELSNLELVAPGNNTTARRGVYVFAEDSGDMYGVVLKNLTIHDVRGYMPSTTGGGSNSSTGKFKNASGGIVVEAQGTTTPTAFHDMQILDNRIYSVDRQGIYFWSNWCKRPDLSRWQTDCTANWYPHTNTIIRGNQLSDIGGDGIVPKMTDGGLVENNNLEGFNVRSRSYNAGMWTANSDNITFQYNRTSGGISTLDGMAYDIDHATNHIIFQYNLSYNNEGGFFLFCPDGSNTKDFIIRYNISINDRAQLFLQGCGGEISNGKIYNNTMYIGNGLSPTVYAQNGSPIRNVEFFNNIVYKTGTGTVGWELTDTDFKLDNNVFYGLTSIPNWATDTITEADPLLVYPNNNDPRGYRLQEGSKAIGAGVLINSNGGKDYFGNLVSSTKVPNIGAYEGNGVLATPEEGCLPSLTIANNTANGIARIMANVSNPCISNYKDLTLSAVGPAGVKISPATKLISTIAPSETVSTEIVVHNALNKPVDNYPIDVYVSNKQGDKLVNSLVNLEVISSSWTSVDHEDFENMTIGQSPNGWVTSGNSQPVITSEGDIQALKLMQSSTINKSVWSFPGKAGTVKLVTRVKAGQSNMPLGLHYLDAQDGEILKLSLNLSGKVSYTNAGAFIDTTTAYKINEWQTLEAVVDRDTSTYIVLLDGVRVGKGTLGSSTNAISKLRLQVPSGSATGSFLVDQVSISEPNVVVPVITLALDQSSYNLEVGDRHQLVLTEMNNGTETDVTSLSHFELIGNDIASVTEAGLLQGIQEGVATIRVVYQGITTEASVVVSSKNEEGLQTIFSGPSVIKLGEYINIRFGVKKAATPLTAQDIIIRYDSNLLQYVDVKVLAAGLSIVDTKSDTLGILRLIVVSKGSENAVSGDQTELLELQLLAKEVAGDESTTIEVTGAVFGDAEGNEYTAQAATHVINLETAGTLGDLNGDGKISIGDLAIIAFHYGKTSSSSDWQLIRVADLNRDGVIGLEDLATLAQQLLE